MAFGIPSPSDLSALATQLGGIVASVGPEEQAVLKTAMDQLSDHATALESKISDDIQAAEKPLVQRLDSLIEESKQWRITAESILATLRAVAGAVAEAPKVQP